MKGELTNLANPNAPKTCPQLLTMAREHAGKGDVHAAEVDDQLAALATLVGQPVLSALRDKLSATLSAFRVAADCYESSHFEQLRDAEMTEANLRQTIDRVETRESTTSNLLDGSRSEAQTARRLLSYALGDAQRRSGRKPQWVREAREFFRGSK